MIEQKCLYCDFVGEAEGVLKKADFMRKEAIERGFCYTIALGSDMVILTKVTLYTTL
jgi:hypothetical protein